MHRINSRQGFAAVEILVIVTALLIVGGTSYYAYRSHAKQSASQNGTLDVKDLGIKLTFPDRNNWSYILNPGSNKSVILDYKDWGGVADITQYTSSPSPYYNNGIDRFSKQEGGTYIVLSKMGCPCSSQDDQYFAQAVTAFKSAVPD
jgi:hypothetical protein